MKNKLRMPSSSGGIVQYFEDSVTKIGISPKQVIFITVLFMVLIIVLHWTNAFGL